MKIKFKKFNFFEKLFKKISNYNEKNYIFLFFLLATLIIIWKLFSISILNNSFYKFLADNQQIGEFTVPVTRGTIYSNMSNSTILATSLNLYDLAIDPTRIGNKEKLIQYLTNIVFKQLCYNNDTIDCYDNVLKFLSLVDIENFDFSTDNINKLIFDKLKEKIYQEKVTSLFLDKELSEEQISKIKSFKNSGLYIVNNYLYLNPEEIKSNEETIDFLTTILGYERKYVADLVRQRDLRYVAIINKLSISIGEEIKNYLQEEKIAIGKGILKKENSIGNFIILSPNPDRYYPENDVASQIIGFVDNNGVGNYGIEGYFDDILKGNNGKIISRKDTSGRIINTISLDNQDFLSEGSKINLTIDRNIQSKVEKILEEGVKTYRANKGNIVIMEPKTGRVLAMANYPNYNLNNYSNVYEIEKVKYSKYPDPKIDLLGYPVFVEDKQNGEKFYYDSKEIFLREATREELGDVVLVKYKYKNDFGPQIYKNDSISSLYEPGSIMKAITVAIGLDTKEITRYGMYQDNGELKIGDFTIKNVSDKCLGYNTFAHALNYSCNVGMIRIVQKVGKVLLYQYLNDFGFSELTNITLSGEVTANIRPWERWSMAQLLTSSYGLGVSVTPLQMANAYSILANGGLYLKPRVVDSIEYPSGKVVEYKTEVIRRVIKESTSNTITQMLNSSINVGVAKNGNVEGYSLAGKTGTSQIPYRGTYEEGIGSTITSYAGYGPIEDPKFVIVVKLDRPRSNEYGSLTSANLFKQTAQYLLDYYGIPKK